MPQDMKEWRRIAKARLFAELGGRCKCGAVTMLTIAHNTPLTKEQDALRSRMGANSRLVLYRKGHRQGLVHLACQSCNNKQQARCQVKLDENPF